MHVIENGLQLQRQRRRAADVLAVALHTTDDRDQSSAHSKRTSAYQDGRDDKAAMHAPKAAGVEQAFEL